MKRLLLIIALLCGTAFAGTCGNGYTYSWKFTIPAANVPNTDQTNFPVTLTFNGAHFYNSYYLPGLATVANGGQIQHTANNAMSISGPADLVFCDAASAGNALNYEVSSYSATTGAMEAHTSIPTASHTSATSFWMFWGNASVSTTQQDAGLGTAANFWSTALFTQVCHLPNGSSLNVNCSLGGTQTNVNTVTANSGVSGGAGNFVAASSQRINLGASYNASAVTVEAWELPATSTANMSIVDNNDTVHGYVIRSGAGGANLTPYFAVCSTGTCTVRNSSVTPGSSTWTNTTATYSGGTLNLYLNGALANGSVSGTDTISNSSLNLNIGSTPAGANYFNGVIDEVRVSNSLRSADWIATTYNDQSSPSSFALANTPTPATGVRVLQYTTCKSAQSVANACVFPNNVVSANLIIVVSSNAGNAGNCTAPNINSKFTDTRGSTFTFAVLSLNGSGGDVCIAFASAAGSGAETITSPSNAVASQSMVAYEIAGTTSVSLDVTSSAFGGGTASISTGSATATTSNSIQLCGLSGTLTGPQQVYSTSVSPTGYVLNTNSPAIGGPINEGGTSFLSFTGSGSKSCTFNFGIGPSNTAVAMAVLKYSPSGSTKRRMAQVY